jgi:putative DNA primase/helicase
VSAAETDEGKHLAEGLVKDLTGGDTIAARFLRAEWFDFRPEFKLWLATNHKPVIRGTDKGIWDRIRPIPFTVSIPEERQDKELANKLMTELAGILAWAVRGCLEWQRTGLGVPEEVREATEGYRTERTCWPPSSMSGARSRPQHRPRRETCTRRTAPGARRVVSAGPARRRSACA